MDELGLTIMEALGHSWCMDNQEDLAAAVVAVMAVVRPIADELAAVNAQCDTMYDALRDLSGLEPYTITPENWRSNDAYQSAEADGYNDALQKAQDIAKGALETVELSCQEDDTLRWYEVIRWRNALLQERIVLQAQNVDLQCRVDELTQNEDAYQAGYEDAIARSNLAVAE